VKYYKIGSRKYVNANHTDYNDEWISYEGFDFSEAWKALQEEKANYECYSTRNEKDLFEVLAEVYDLPDGIDTSDEDEVINALCDCCGCDDMSNCNIYQAVRNIANKSQKEFAQILKIPYDTWQKWELEKTKCPTYVTDLIIYKLMNEKII
jgi:hypothetical protein